MIGWVWYTYNCVDIKKMKNNKSHDKFPNEANNEEIVKEGFEEAADQVAKYFGWDDDKSTRDFPYSINIVFPNRELSSKEIVEIMAKSLDEENWKELENQGVIIKREENEKR
jgi:hypothetical protein